jgi:hypothetical protein
MLVLSEFKSIFLLSQGTSHKCGKKAKIWANAAFGDYSNNLPLF